jgi:ferredoxin like protein
MEGDERMSVEERLFSIRYRADDQSHLLIKNQAVCELCSNKACEWFCPADVYSWNAEERMLAVAHENCLECGTCRIACDFGNIAWQYPTGGYGISYKFG